MNNHAYNNMLNRDKNTMLLRIIALSHYRIGKLTEINRTVIVRYDGTVIEDKPAPEILYPDFEPRSLPSGKRRKADVSLSKDKL